MCIRAQNKYTGREKLCTAAVISFQNIGANLNLLANTKVGDIWANKVHFWPPILKANIQICQSIWTNLIALPPRRYVCRDTHDCPAVVMIPNLSKHCQNWPNYLLLPTAQTKSRCKIQRSLSKFVKILSSFYWWPNLPKRGLSLPTNYVHSQKEQQLCQRSKAFFEFSQFVFPFWATFCKIRGRPGKFYCFVLQKPPRDWGPSGHIRDIWTSARPWIFKDVWNLPGRQLSRYLSQIELFTLHN